MASIGQIIQLPSAYSDFARVRDEYGTARNMAKKDLPEDVEVGDELPYRVEIQDNDSGGSVALKHFSYGPK